MGTAPKLVSPRKKPLDPQVKSWIDNVIVPTLVREFLASEKKQRESADDDVPMVQCTIAETSPEGAV